MKMVPETTKKILLLSDSVFVFVFVLFFVVYIYIYYISQLVRIYYTSSVLDTVASSFACFAQVLSGRESGKIFL